VTGGARFVWLGLAALPYLAMVGVDTWMHEAARKVPRTEKTIHWILAPLLSGFLISAFLARNAIAATLLSAAAVLLVIDEVGFHRPLARSERLVHTVAYVALGGFVATWAWMDFLP